MTVSLCTVADALVHAAGSGGGSGVRTIEHDGRTLHFTYATLLADALRVGGSLVSAGLVPGDRVALIVPEVAEFVQAFFGITTAGLVPVPLCPPAQAGDLGTFAKQSRHVLEASRAGAVITSADVAPLIDLRGLPRAPRVYTLDALTGPPLERPVTTNIDAPALVQFTSGSTAAPKGVVLSHRNLHANADAIAGPNGLNVHPGDVGVSWLPLYHDMGLIGMLLAAVYSSLDTVLLSPVLFLKRPSAWLEAISAYRGTVSFAPNFAYGLCTRRVKSAQVNSLDLTSWRAAGCGAEPIRAETLRAFADHFADSGFRASSFITSYGLAEHSLAVSFRSGILVDRVDAADLGSRSLAVPSANGGSPAVSVVSCGRAFPGHEIRIVDESGRPLPDRHVGSIVARGPSVMLGYFDDPSATAQTLRDGWLYTGDLGYVAGGELYVCGRTKDLIIRQGRKYHPADIESAITDLPGMRASGVVVFAIQKLDESDEIVAVLEARASVASEDVIDQVRRRVREAAGVELDRVVVVPPGSIPRTTSGKVRRAETRVRFEAGTLVAARGGPVPEHVSR